MSALAVFTTEDGLIAVFPERIKIVETSKYLGFGACVSFENSRRERHIKESVEEAVKIVSWAQSGYTKEQWKEAERCAEEAAKAIEKLIENRSTMTTLPNCDEN